MPVQCAKCGEELMGAVNRCWRCGQEFGAFSTDTGLPPLRRSPVATAANEVWDAELSEVTPQLPNSPVVGGAADKIHAARSVRRGSPFRDRGTATLVAIESEPAPNAQGLSSDREANYLRNGGAAASAVLTIPLGLISFVAAFLFPLAGFLLAIMGLGLGVWGINSRRRGLVVAGLLLCCLSLATATFNGVVEIYVASYGAAPWETDSSLP